VPDDTQQREPVVLEQSVDSARLMRLFQSLPSAEDRDNLFRVVEAFVQNVRNRQPK
jgi:hypothetical protein